MASPRLTTTSRLTWEKAEKAGERGLRMRERGRDTLAGIARDHRPRAIVEIKIEARQHDRTLRRPRDCQKKARGCAIGARRADGDDRTA